jgi:hypothetical protein
VIGTALALIAILRKRAANALKAGL